MKITHNIELHLRNERLKLEIDTSYNIFIFKSRIEFDEIWQSAGSVNKLLGISIQ